MRGQEAAEAHTLILLQLKDILASRHCERLATALACAMQDMEVQTPDRVILGAEVIAYKQGFPSFTGHHETADSQH